MNSFSVDTPVPENMESSKSSAEEIKIEDYRAPQSFVVGKTVDLLRSYNRGEYKDAYSGYYWSG